MKKLIKSTCLTGVILASMFGGISVFADTQNKEMPVMKWEQTNADGTRVKIGMANPFAKLKEDGKISADTYAKIEAFMNSKIEAKKAEFEAAKATKPASGEKVKVVRQERTNILDEMLSQAVITQAEYDTIKAAMPEKTQEHKNIMKKDFNPANRINGYQKFVENGIIDQATCDSIKSYMETKMAEFKATPVTEGDVKVKKIKSVDMTAELVEKGIITQTQADAMKAYIKTAKPQKAEKATTTEAK